MHPWPRLLPRTMLISKGCSELPLLLTGCGACGRVNPAPHLGSVVVMALAGGTQGKVALRCESGGAGSTPSLVERTPSGLGAGERVG